MISFITVTKGRLELLEQACDSIWNRAKDPSKIDHIVLYDPGDIQTEEFCRKYKEKYPQFRIKHLSPPVENYETRNLTEEYLNFGVKVSSGNILFGLTNDGLVLTEDYDQIIEDSLIEFKERNGHDVVQFLVNDGGDDNLEEYKKGEPFSAFLVLSKRATTAIGGLGPKELPFQGIDVWVNRLFKICDCQIDLTDKVKIDHISHYNGKYPVDEITTSRPNHFSNNMLHPDVFNEYLFKINKVKNDCSV